MRLVRTVVVLVVAVLSAAVAVPPAVAHDEVGELSVLEAATGTDGSVRYAVRLTYADDGHPAEDATVTAVAEQPGARSVGPVSLTETAPGSYAGSLTLTDPGTWTVRFSALSPLATLETTHQVGAGTSTSAPSSSTAAATTATTAAPSTVAPVPPTTGPPTTVSTTTPTTGVRDAGSSDGKGSGAAVVALVVVAGLALIVLAAAWAYRRRSRSD